MDYEKLNVEKQSEIIGKLLTQFRLERGYTQKEISEAINIAQQTYAGYERGRHEPNIKTLILLAEIYGVSLDILAGRYNITSNEYLKNRLVDEKIELYDSRNEIELEATERIMKRKYNRAKKKHGI